MQKYHALSALLSVGAAAFALAACGDSTPEAGGISQQIDAQAQSRAPSTGSFKRIAVDALPKDARAMPDCNIDTIDGNPAGGVTLDHAAKPVFAGWAADTISKSVPRTVKIVLKGAQDYAVDAATGYSRNDVAKAQKQPAFATSGYQLRADLSAVPAGGYLLVLFYDTHGEHLTCDPKKSLTVR